MDCVKFFIDVSKGFFIAWITINGNKQAQCLRIQSHTGAKTLGMFIVVANLSNEKLNAALIRDTGHPLTYVWSSHYIAIYTEHQTSMIRNTTLVLTNIYWVVLGPTFFSDVSKRFFIAWITINGNKHTQCLRIQNYTGAKFLCIYIVASNYLLIDVIAHSH